jgi:hypothetical protein
VNAIRSVSVGGIVLRHETDVQAGIITKKRIKTEKRSTGRARVIGNETGTGMTRRGKKATTATIDGGDAANTSA